MAFGQQFPLELHVQQDENLFTVVNGTQIQVSADGVGTISTIRITAINRGASPLVFREQPVLLGSTAFSVGDLEGLPIDLL